MQSYLKDFNFVSNRYGSNEFEYLIESSELLDL